MPKSLRFQTALLHLPDDPLFWTARLLIPADIVAQVPRRDDGAHRIICQVTGLKDTWHAALTSDGQGGHYLIFNKARLRELTKKGLDQQALTVTLTPDDSDYGVPMPVELAEVLAQDPHGDKYFHALTAGKQRNLLYFIGRYKTEGTRLRKAITIIDYLVEVRGKLDFRELNAYLKERG